MREHRLLNAYHLSKGPESVFRFPATNASTAITSRAIVKLASGKVADMTDNTRPFGIAQKAKASSDTSTDAIAIEIVKRGSEYKAEVTAGTVVATDVGSLVDVDYGGSRPDGINLTEVRNDMGLVGADVANNIGYVTFLAPYY
jgi:hypothetical protein